MKRAWDAEPKGRPGRPCAYDPETVLLHATDRFWRSGYSGTSLDELCDATGLSRSSLYAAFSDKHALYLKASRALLAARQVRDTGGPCGPPTRLGRGSDARL